MPTFICPKCSHQTVYDPANGFPYCEQCGTQSPELSSTIEELINEGVQLANAGDELSALKHFKQAQEYPLTLEQKAGIALWLGHLEPNPSIKRKYVEEALLVAPNNAIRTLAEKELSKIDRQIQEHEDQQDTERLASLSATQNILQSNQAQITPDIPEKAVVCPSCGAGYLLPAHLHSITCPYCLTNFNQREARKCAFTPANGVLPFTIDLGSAKEILSGFLKQENIHIDTNTLTSMPAIYLPAWVFQITAEIESSPNWNSTHPPEQSEERFIRFENIPVSATKHLSDELILGLSDYSYDNFNPYDPTTFLEVPVEAANISKDEASQEARIETLSQLIKTLTESDRELFRREIDPNELTIQESKLIFIPAWLASYYYRGSLYHILINGQNGKIVVEHPPFF